MLVLNVKATNKQQTQRNLFRSFFNLYFLFSLSLV